MIERNKIYKNMLREAKPLELLKLYANNNKNLVRYNEDVKQQAIIAENIQMIEDEILRRMGLRRKRKNEKN